MTLCTIYKLPVTWYTIITPTSGSTKTFLKITFLGQIMESGGLF